MVGSKEQKDIICTLGPTSSVPDVLLQMARAGMSVLRVNCSHYDPKLTRQLVAVLRMQQAQIRILVDLQGPRIRVGAGFPEKSIRESQLVQFVSEVNFISPRRKDIIAIPLSLDCPFNSLHKAAVIYMKDGTLAFDVVDNRAAEGFIVARTRWTGPVRGEKAVHVPDLPPASSALTAKDIADLAFAADIDADCLMLSFINKAEDIQQLRAAWDKLGTSRKPEFWAKIETRQAIQHLPEICAAADAILIGRGDLAVDVGQFEAPAEQSRILEAAQKSATRCYVATQVLESMRTNPYPSRSELRDIYVSLREGAAGFMLTAETSVGRFPVQAIEVVREMVKRYAAADTPPAGKRKARSTGK